MVLPNDRKLGRLSWTWDRSPAAPLLGADLASTGRVNLLISQQHRTFRARDCCRLSNTPVTISAPYWALYSLVGNRYIAYGNKNMFEVPYRTPVNN